MIGGRWRGGRIIFACDELLSAKQERAFAQASVVPPGPRAARSIVSTESGVACVDPSPSAPCGFGKRARIPELGAAGEPYPVHGRENRAPRAASQHVPPQTRCCRRRPARRSPLGRADAIKGGFALSRWPWTGASARGPGESLGSRRSGRRQARGSRGPAGARSHGRTRRHRPIPSVLVVQAFLAASVGTPAAPPARAHVPQAKCALILTLAQAFSYKRQIAVV